MIAKKDWRMHRQELLAELNELCRRKGIRLYLLRETALAAYRDGSLSDTVYTCIDMNDAKKLMSAVRWQRGRLHTVIESMLSNDHYPRFELRYCDTETTEFNLSQLHHYDNNCIHITIKLISHIPEDATEYKAAQAEYRQHLSALAEGTNSTKDAARIFRRLMKAGSNRSQRVSVGKQRLDYSCFINAETIELEGQSYLVPGPCGNYLKETFGSDWRDHTLHRFRESSVRFISADFAWSEYRDAVSYIDLDGYSALCDERDRVSELFAEKHRVISGYYDILDRTVDRFRLYCKYYPQKEALLEMEKNGQTAQLREELSEYIELIDRYYRLGLGLCFDKEIFELTLRLMSSEFGSSYADSVRAEVPAKHLESLQLKDYRGELIK